MQEATVRGLKAHLQAPANRAVFDDMRRIADHLGLPVTVVAL